MDDISRILEAALRPSPTIESISDWTGIPADEVLAILTDHGINYSVNSDDVLTIIPTIAYQGKPEILPTQIAAE